MWEDDDLVGDLRVADDLALHDGWLDDFEMSPAEPIQDADIVSVFVEEANEWE